jgi:hypothetical protein
MTEYYEPTVYQKSAFELVHGELRKTRPIKFRSPKKILQYVVAKFAVIVELLEKGETITAGGGGFTCAACWKYDEGCEECIVVEQCNSVADENLVGKRVAGEGFKLTPARRVLRMVQRRYKKLYRES